MTPDRLAFVAAVLIVDLAAAHAFVAWFTRRARALPPDVVEFRRRLRETPMPRPVCWCGDFIRPGEYHEDEWAHFGAPSWPHRAEPVGGAGL